MMDGTWPCCICGITDEVLFKQNPWGDLCVVCKPCIPEFVNKFKGAWG